MSTKAARNILFLTYFISFILLLVLLSIPLVRKEIYPDTMFSFLGDMLFIYLVPLSVILGSYFGQQKQKESDIPKNSFMVALAVSFMWNALLFFGFILFFLKGIEYIEQLKEYFDLIATKGSFLITGALAYYFTKKE